MNGSRSNTPTHGGKPSLDQLNRTIEGLEARIQGLMGDRQRPAAAVPVDAILERQRNLGSARERVASVIDRQRPEPPRHDAVRPDASRSDGRYEAGPLPPQEHAWDRPAPRVAAPDPALSEIAATLGALRQELRQGLDQTGDLRESLGAIHSEMRSLKSAAATAPVMDLEALRQDLGHLGASLDRLERSSRSADTGHLRADLDELRAMLTGVAHEESLRSLEARVAAFDPNAVREELVQLAWRIDGLKSGLGDLSAGPAVRALEDKLMALAGAVEAVGRNVQNQTGIAEHFSTLDHRLDEISRAIAASSRQTGSVFDGSTLQRLETRIDDLVDHIAALPQPEPAGALNNRFELLAERIEELANEEAARRLEDRIAQLANLIERNFRESTAPAGFADHLQDISSKIDKLGTAPAEDLLARLDMLSRKLDHLEVGQPAAAAAPGDAVAMSRLESRLADIAARLDESAAAPAADTVALQNLERQIANLSALLSAPGAASANASGFSDGLGDRLNAIEDYIASSDEFIVEAARQAAETVVEAYSRNGMASHGASPADIAALSGLAEDLRALEAHTRSSEERTQATFEALHDTLVQIAGRLNDLGNAASQPALQPATRAVEREPSAEPVRETTARLRESVAMPRAAQPDFAPVEVEAPTARRAPENSKVEVLDETLLMPTAESTVQPVKAEPAGARADAAPKASKSIIAGLAARLKPSKKTKDAGDGKRLAVDPAPALDPGEAVVEAEPTMLLEPGAGVPDVKKILERVRNGQQSGPRGDTNGSTSDVIAAARRAAQAAAAEAGSQRLAQPTAFKKDKDKKPGKPAATTGESQVRRPILLAAAAVLLVIMSYPLVSNLIGGRANDAATQAPPQERSLMLQADDPATKTATTDVAPATDATASDKASDTAGMTDTTPPVTSDEPADKPADTTTDSVPVKQSAADQILIPAENADQATTFEKPAKTADAELASAEPMPDKALQAKTDAKPDDLASLPSDAKDSGTIALPEGLQPAALAFAAKKGDALALFEIGARYTDGRGVKTDLAEAAKWYALAADKGMAPAEYRLANFYEKGTGVTRDVEKAKSLYKSAAEKGNASAMHNLAVLFATGIGGTPDFAEAARWFKQAAELNVRDSQFNLAILYARGNGVPQDLEETYKWFAIAAREGDQDAAQKRDEVANALSPDQLKSAKAKLDLWKPQPMNDAANTPMVPDAWLAKGQTTASVDMKRAIRNIQAILNMNGFDAGKPDGEMGKKTVAAIKAFQKTINQEPTGRIDDALVKELLKRNKPKG
jgi:localization factor PodJL